MMDPFDARIVGEVEALRASRDAALARVGVLEAAKCDPDCVHCAAWRDRMGRYRSARAALSSPPPHQKEEPCHHPASATWGDGRTCCVKCGADVPPPTGDATGGP